MYIYTDGRCAQYTVPVQNKFVQSVSEKEFQQFIVEL